VDGQDTDIPFVYAGDGARLIDEPTRPERQMWYANLPRTMFDPDIVGHNIKVLDEWAHNE
jgi:hypothetical protein